MGQTLRNPQFFLRKIKKLEIEEICMNRQLGLHHTNTRNRTHAGHPIFKQSARSSTALDSFSPPDITDELCQFVTAVVSL
jgi:hypothetical protein